MPIIESRTLKHERYNALSWFLGYSEKVFCEIFVELYVLLENVIQIDAIYAPLKVFKVIHQIVPKDMDDRLDLVRSSGGEPIFICLSKNSLSSYGGVT